MNIVDIIIIVILLLAGITGAKRGVIKETVLCVGTILIFYLAYKFKDPLANFLLLRLPMFDFPNLFKGVITLNILVYQLFSFMIILALMLVIFNIIVGITSLFEKILKLTIILGIPSKILGFIVGVIEGYVILFVVLFFLTQPAFSFDLFMESKFSNTILTSSPVLTNIANDTIDVIQDVYKLKDEKDANIVNRKSLDMMLEKKVVQYDIVKELRDNGKINFDGIDDILEKYNGAR